MTLISIITPAYNCKDLIKKTYESVLSQTYKNWEWIIIEDHSIDDSYEYIKELIKDDKRIILLRTERNSGAAIARNIGIQKAKGRFIAFLDADDIWKKSKLEEQVNFMLKNNYEFTYTDYDLLFPKGNIRPYVSKKNKTTYKKLLVRNDIGCLTVMLDISKIGKLYMPVDCYKREDYGYWLDITKKGIVGHKLNKSLSIYRLSNNSVSSNKLKMMSYHYKVYRHHEKFNFFKSHYYLLRMSLYKLFKYH